MDLKNRGINAEFKRNELYKLSSLAKEDPLEDYFRHQIKKIDENRRFPNCTTKTPKLQAQENKIFKILFATVLIRNKNICMFVSKLGAFIQGLKFKFIIISNWQRLPIFEWNKSSSG